MSYLVEKSDINILKKQIDVSDSKAIKLLKKYSGDITECVLDHYKFSESELVNEQKSENQEKIEKLRLICDEREKIFVKEIEKLKLEESNLKK